MHTPTMSSSEMSVSLCFAICRSATVCDVHGPPAVAQACLEHFAAQLQQPGQLASAEHIGAKAREGLIVISSAFTVETPKSRASRA